MERSVNYVYGFVYLVYAISLPSAVFIEFPRVTTGGPGSVGDLCLVYLWPAGRLIWKPKGNKIFVSFHSLSPFLYPTFTLALC